MLKDLIKVEDRVRWLLHTYPETRDSDKMLWLAYNVCFNGLKELCSSQTINYLSFKQWLLKNETPVFESLSRARRKIQEDSPALQGDKASRLEEEQQVRNYLS